MWPAKRAGLIGAEWRPLKSEEYSTASGSGEPRPEVRGWEEGFCGQEMILMEN